VPSSPCPAAVTRRRSPRPASFAPADGRSDFEATGSEWRTRPLWGLGLSGAVDGYLFLLHDGRARDFAEAILWHGGQAKAASESFRNLPKSDRDALVAFLESL
jgi:CxxC motif-containing protein (DUF1111 family)